MQKRAAGKDPRLLFFPPALGRTLGCVHARSHRLQLPSGLAGPALPAQHAPFTCPLQELLMRDPSLRLGAQTGAEEIKAHAFFKSIDWALIRWLPPPFVPKVEAGAGDVPDGGVFPMD